MGALIRTVRGSVTHTGRCLCACVPGEVMAYGSWIRRHSVISWGSFVLTHHLNPSAGEKNALSGSLSWTIISFSLSPVHLTEPPSRAAGQGCAETKLESTNTPLSALVSPLNEGRVRLKKPAWQLTASKIRMWKRKKKKKKDISAGAQLFDYQLHLTQI